ncbi:MAG TPA: hypothetical protein VM870_03285 [Pyrinomonadaceae bacterium]|nr:hypothetical protein [Pyrinomonadaceae bacterium]
MMKIFLTILLAALASAEISAALAPPRRQNNGEQIRTPEKGSPERKAILDAVRRKLKTSTQFEVDHLKVSGRWAFFRGNAVVFTDGEKVETDSVQALLERREEAAGVGRWAVVEIWNLEQSGTAEMAQNFARRVRKRAADEGVPKEILPAEL